MWNVSTLASVALLAALAAFTAFNSQAADITGRASVIDGDTIEIRGERIRLHGIDAPESGQRCRDAAGAEYRCGKASAFWLADLIRATPVECYTRDVDRYGRLIGECYFRGGAGERININAAIVEAGHALAYRRYSTEYAFDEARAKTARLGMWSGSFEAPWDWRKARR